MTNIHCISETMMKYFQCVLINCLLILPTSAHSDDKTIICVKIFDHMLRLERLVTKQSLKLEQTESEIVTLKKKLAATSLTSSENSHRLTEMTSDLERHSSEIFNLTKLAGNISQLASFEVRQIANPITLGRNEILKFDEVTLNRGGAYNPKSGIFTAPVPGTYIFWANIMSTDAGYFHINLYQDNNLLARGYTSNGPTYGTARIVYITHVNKDQHVWFLNMDSGARIHGDYHSNYGGTLMTTL